LIEELVEKKEKEVENGEENEEKEENEEQEENEEKELEEKIEKEKVVLQLEPQRPKVKTILPRPNSGESVRASQAQ
jgi:hypothetical protein